MASFKFSVPHQLGQAEAQRRLQQLFPELEQKYGALITRADYQWQGNLCYFRLLIRALTISGRLLVEATYVEIELDLPLAGLFFKDKIQDTIQSQARILLGPGKK